MGIVSISFAYPEVLDPISERFLGNHSSQNISNISNISDSSNSNVSNNIMILTTRLLKIIQMENQIFLMIILK